MIQVTVEHGIKNVKKRNGEVIGFESNKIFTAVKKAFIGQGIVDEAIFNNLTNAVVNILNVRFMSDSVPTVEYIQDIVEDVLIHSNHPKVAKAYILYRADHKQRREEATLKEIQAHRLEVTKADGSVEAFDPESIRNELDRTRTGLTHVNVDAITDEVSKTVYNGILESELHNLILNATKTKIEYHYDYSSMCARLVLNKVYRQNLHCSIYSENLGDCYQNQFSSYIHKGIDLELLNPELRTFDLYRLSKVIDSSRDHLFVFLGMQTLYDRYLLRTRKEKMVFELPQWLWMRVAMGLALKEEDREAKAIEFYNTLSNLYLVSSTPTLFNSGTTHSQMSSCYINQVDDSMTGIFKTISDCAQLSKWAGGIGTDWTSVRAKGADIKGTNGESQGIIPFIKIFNDVALAVNQGGKRKGAMAAYLEVWHSDVDEFLELKKNTGDERRRAHDIHTAVLIPDLFMKRVREKGDWTLFSPDTVTDLPDLYGKAFEERYAYYETQDFVTKRVVKAVDLWRKMLTMLYETGHPWITFKDPINVRNTQDHVGVVHSSNLCTEITLNTSKEETAVCNLASVNLSKMIHKKQLNRDLIEKTVTTGMRMLDNVIDNNFYPTPEAENANSKHRAVGLGMMGYQDALYQMEIDFDSDANLAFADESMELISYYSILTSSMLAKEKGSYSSFKGSKWDRGILPFDTLALLEEQRGEILLTDKSSKLDWTTVRDHIKDHGMRNSNCMALAPTATISNIVGTTPSVEPTFKNIFMKENLSGNFMVINKFLIDALSEVSLWNESTITQMKINNGSILDIDEIPADIRRRFKETFEIDSSWIIKAAAIRGKWIDQAASTNIFMKTNSGKALNQTYTMAWEYGLKTTYYLRSLASSQVTKTVSVQDVVPSSEELPPPKESSVLVNPDIKVCSIIDPDCEACQ